MKSFKVLSKQTWIGALFTLAMILYFAVGCEMGPPKNSLAAQTMRGQKLFNEKCAPCHGTNAKMETATITADSLGMEAKDLSTIITRRGIKQFPLQEIASIIDGRKEVAAHGPREMPVWGEVFESQDLTEEQIRGKLGELIAYLMNIQD